MEDPANAALHLITFAFGATLWAMPKHKDLVVKMLPFFLGAWLGFTSPDLAKFPMGSECNGIFGIDMLRPNPGCFALGMLGIPAGSGGIREQVVMACATGVLASFFFMVGLKVLVVMAVMYLADAINPLKNSTFGRMAMIPVNMFIASMTWMFVSSIAWVLSPVTILLYPALATVLLLHGGEYFLDGEVVNGTRVHSNNCVSADAFSVSLNPLTGMGAKFDFDKCTDAMKTVAVVLYCAGVAHHLSARMNFFASGAMGAALEHTTSGKAHKVMDYDGVPEPSPAKPSAKPSPAAKKTSQSRSPSPAPRKSTKSASKAKAASRSPSPAAPKAKAASRSPSPAAADAKAKRRRSVKQLV